MLEPPNRHPLDAGKVGWHDDFARISSTETSFSNPLLPRIDNVLFVFQTLHRVAEVQRRRRRRQLAGSGGTHRSTFVYSLCGGVGFWPYADKSGERVPRKWGESADFLSGRISQRPSPLVRSLQRHEAYRWRGINRSDRLIDLSPLAAAVGYSFGTQRCLPSKGQAGWMASQKNEDAWHGRAE